jgi:hypothetical protein
MKYRKKPIVIEAVQYLGVNKAFNLFNEYPEWLTKAINTREIGLSGGYCGQIGIKTLEGHVWASPGDYIIQGVKGELYPCKPDIFEQTYDRDKGEPVNE